MSSTSETVFINGQEVRKDEKVLVERGGKFELVSASKLKTMIPEIEDKDSGKKEPQKSKKSTNDDSPKSKPKSARRPAKPKFNKTDTIDYKTIKSPYAMSPEMKEMMRKQAEAKAAKQLEEEKQAQLADDEARKSAEQAWKAWVEKKNKEMKDQKPLNDKAVEKERAKQKQEAVQAYRSWLHSKHRQMRKERLHKQQLQIEQDEGFYMRERRDCNKAFKAWVKNKSKNAKNEQKISDEAKRQTKLEAKRAKRTQNFLKSLQESQQLKYMEYYGYRF